MAQRIQSVPNPAYQVAPLTTIGGSIVSRRRVKIPVTNPTTFVGLRNITAGQSYLYFDLADNESFLDLTKMMMCIDFVLNAPNGPSGNTVTTTDTTIRDDLVTCFDQSTQAIIASLEIGSAQGLKFEQIQNYNMLANINALAVQPAMSKETSELDWSDYEKNSQKHYGLDKVKDGTLTFIGHSHMKPGVTQRLHLRFLHSSFLNNVRMLPLFLLRNGLRLQVNFESAFKVFHLPVSSAPGRTIVLPAHVTRTPNIVMAPGLWNWNTGLANTITGPGTVPINSTGILPIFDFRQFNTLQLHSYASGSWTGVKSYANIFIDAKTYQLVVKPFIGSPSQSAASSRLTNHFVAIPITLYEYYNVASGTTTATTNGSTTASTTVKRPYWNGIALFNPKGLIRQQSTTASTDQRSMQLDVVMQGFPATLLNVSSGVYWQSDNSANADRSIGSSTTTCLVNSGITVDTIASDGTLRMTLDNDDTFATYVGFGAAQGQDISTENHRYAIGALYSLNDQLPLAPCNFPADRTGQRTANVVNSQIARGLTYAFHVEDAFYINQGGPFTGLISGQSFEAVNYQKVIAQQPSAASSALSLWQYSDRVRQSMSYTITNAEMLVDLVKPAAEDFFRFQTAFQSPQGIPYKFNRLIYRKNTYERASGTVQVSVPVSPRSLTALFFVLADPLMDLESSDSIQALLTSNLSSFQSRGLTRAEVIIGGQLYPVYPMNLKPDSSDFNNANIPELENVFGGSIDGAMQRISSTRVRNYLAGGTLDVATSTLQAASAFGGDLLGATRLKFVDTPHAIYGFSMAKSDMMPFTTGIDASQSGSVQLNLYFQDAEGDPANLFTSGRRFDIHLWARCDAVATLQESSNTVRF